MRIPFSNNSARWRSVHLFASLRAAEAASLPVVLEGYIGAVGDEEFLLGVVMTVEFVLGCFPTLFCFADICNKFFVM